MFGITDNVVKRLLSNSMEKWRIKLYSSSTMRGEIRDQEGYIPRRFPITSVVCGLDDTVKTTVREDQVQILPQRQTSEPSTLHE